MLADSGLSITVGINSRLPTHNKDDKVPEWDALEQGRRKLAEESEEGEFDKGRYELTCDPQIGENLEPNQVNLRQIISCIKAFASSVKSLQVKPASNQGSGQAADPATQPVAKPTALSDPGKQEATTHQYLP